jgi:hypothetical protein
MAFPPIRNFRAFSLNDFSQPFLGLPHLLLLVGGQVSTDRMFHAADGYFIVCHRIKNVQQNRCPTAAKNAVAGGPHVDEVTPVIATTYGGKHIRFCDPVQGRLAPFPPISSLAYSDPDVTEDSFPPLMTKRNTGPFGTTCPNAPKAN